MKKLSVKSIAVCLMAFLMIGLCIAFTACGDKGPGQTDDTGNTDITDDTDDTGNTDDTDNAGETPPMTVYTFESCSGTVDGENVPVPDEVLDVYEGTQAYFKDEKFYMTMYGGEVGWSYTYEDGIYVIDYDMPNLPGSEGITVTMHVTVNADTLTVTIVANASGQQTVEIFIYKA